jgi:isoleucyl-tRNA synthetase
MSVHLEKFPNIAHFKPVREVVEQMDFVREICSFALGIRKKHNIRVRCPLNELKIISQRFKKINKFEEIIKDELNIKKITFISDIQNYSKKTVSINFALCGKRLGANMKTVLTAYKTGEYEISADNKTLKIAGETLHESEFNVVLVPILTETEAGFDYITTPSNDLILLDITISEALELEAISRDFVRLVQNLRKEARLDFSDTVAIKYFTSNPKIKQSIENFSDYILTQTIGKSIFFEQNLLASEYPLYEDTIRLSI